MEEYLNIFTKYIKDNYDTDNQLIRQKYFHSLEVAKLMILLGKELELSDEDMHLAFVIGLTHDLGRFHEIKNKGVMNNLTFDHGAYSVKILYNDGLVNSFDLQRKDDLVVKKALYFHNKQDIDRKTTSRELMFCNLLRDADKIDILRVVTERGNFRFVDFPSKHFINNFMNNRTIDLKYRKNKSDTVILYLSFIKDLFYNESYNYAIDKHLLEQFIQNVYVAIDRAGLFNILVDRVKKRGEENVR